MGEMRAYACYEHSEATFEYFVKKAAFLSNN